MVYQHFLSRLSSLVGWYSLYLQQIAKLIFKIMKIPKPLHPVLAALLIAWLSGCSTTFVPSDIDRNGLPLSSEELAQIERNVAGLSYTTFKGLYYGSIDDGRVKNSIKYSVIIDRSDPDLPKLRAEMFPRMGGLALSLLIVEGEEALFLDQVEKISAQDDVETLLKYSLLKAELSLEEFVGLLLATPESYERGIRTSSGVWLLGDRVVWKLDSDNKLRAAQVYNSSGKVALTVSYSESNIKGFPQVEVTTKQFLMNLRPAKTFIDRKIKPSLFEVVIPDEYSRY